MAEKRMFTKKITLSDAFLDMPVSARLLYYDLNMNADDDGFVGNPKTILRITGAREDDLKVLLSKRFILAFESGIIVIKHWKMHNCIQSDRHKATVYKEEMSQLTVKENKSYTECIQIGNRMETDCIQNVNNLETQVRLGKVRLEKVRGGDVEKKSYHGYELVKLTESEYHTLLEKYGESQTKALLEKLDAYKLAKGKTYKSDMGAIRQWVIGVIKPTEQKPDQNVCPICSSRLVNVCKNCGFARGDDVAEKRKEWADAQH